MLLSSKNESNFIMSEQDILKSKIGSLYDYKNNNIDEDKQIMILILLIKNNF